MPIDYNQLLSILIEETLENLADIDESLLTIDLDTIDPEKTNQLFRSIHTIKGNSVLFKLEGVGKLMHSVETFLEPVRSGIIKLERNHIDLLLQLADILRKTLSDIQIKKPINEASLQNLASVFQNLSNNKENKIEPRSVKQNGMDSTQSTTDISKKWHILIQPRKDIFKKNLEPANAFSLLQEQGQLMVKAIPDKLPPFNVFDPLQCYLSWELDFVTNLKKEQILEILSWIFEDQDIQIAEIAVEETSDTEGSKKLPKTDPLEAAGSYHTPSTLRIATKKIDALMNLVGELVIIQSILTQALKKIELKQSGILDEPLDLLAKNTRSLQELVLRIRMVPIAFAVNRFPRMVFDIASKMHKLVDFNILGDQTEIDKAMIEKISDPLLHIVRNAIDHGIESPEMREKLGKNKKGLLQLVASQEGGNILIEIKDDGAGIDPEKIRKIAISKGLINEKIEINPEELYKILFKPGFSMAENVTEYSGRGVGLDVVEKNIKLFGGSIQLTSRFGKGTSFKIRLPLTLAMIECQLIEVAKQVYMVPLSKIIAMEQMNRDNIIYEDNEQRYRFGEKNIQLICLEKVLHNDKSSEAIKKRYVKGYVVIVETSEQYFALECDELLLQQTVVIKNLEENYCKVSGLAGGAIMGNGEVGLILDVQGIIDIANQSPENSGKMIEANFFFQKTSLSDNKGLGSSHDQVSDMAVTGPLEMICFNLGKTEYAVNLSLVREVKSTAVLTVLPFSPSYLSGVINLHGHIVPVVDLRLFFNIKEEPYHSLKMLIIVNLEDRGVGKLIGLMVDGINDTHVIDNEEIGSIPKTGYLALKDYIQGFVYINKRIITLLKIQNILKVNKGLGVINDRNF